MKQKIKLRDLTPEQYSKYKEGGCGCNGSCNECMFGSVNCVSASKSCWVFHKDLYSDKFLDQEIEIEAPTFTDTEREYLHNWLKPFKDRIEEIKLVKVGTFENDTITYLLIIIQSILSLEQLESIFLPYFKFGTMYRVLELGKAYRDDELKELLRELELL